MMIINDRIVNIAQDYKILYYTTYDDPVLADVICIEQKALRELMP